jgi:hypothetical protein
MPTRRELAGERLRSSTESLRVAAGLARLQAELVAAIDHSAEDHCRLGDAFIVFASELKMIADAMEDRSSNLTSDGSTD